MARKTSKRTAKKENISEEEENNNIPDYSAAEKNPGEDKKTNPLLWVLAAAIIILGFLLYKNKDLLVVATVNGKPIYSWDLNTQLRSQYGKAALDQMVNEQVLKDEAAKKKITVSQKEIDAKVAEATKTLPKGMTLAEALAQQGMSREQFNKQVEIRVLIDKLMGDKVKVSSKEVDDYIAQNKEILNTQVGEDSAKQRKYAEDTLKQQKSSQEFSKWFEGVKKNAKISTYLK